MEFKTLWEMARFTYISFGIHYSLEKTRESQDKLLMIVAVLKLLCEATVKKTQNYMLKNNYEKMSVYTLDTPD